MKFLIYITGKQGVGKSVLCRKSGWYEIEYTPEQSVTDLTETIDFQFLNFDTVAVVSNKYKTVIEGLLEREAARHKAKFIHIEL